VQVDLPTSSVSFFDLRPFAVSVEPADQVGGDLEHTVSRLMSGNPAAKHGDKVRAKGDGIVSTVLRDSGTQADDRDRTVEVEVGDPETPDFAGSQARSRQERVQVGPVVP
jgi:hypothetical protein